MSISLTNMEGLPTILCRAFGTNQRKPVKLGRTRKVWYLLLRVFFDCYFQSLISYQVCYTRYHVSFYLWLIGSVLKHCKVPKYYEQDCLKIFFLISAVPAMIRISGANAHLLQKCYFCQKTTNKRRWNLSRVNFWSKLSMQNTAYTKPLNLEF